MKSYLHICDLKDLEKTTVHFVHTWIQVCYQGQIYPCQCHTSLAVHQYCYIHSCEQSDKLNIFIVIYILIFMSHSINVAYLRKFSVSLHLSFEFSYIWQKHLFQNFETSSI